MKDLIETAWLRRLVACLFGGFVLALMVGNQEGSQNDFGESFNRATTIGRLSVFLLIGFLLFLALTFWPLIKPYLNRPGASTIAIGLVLVIVGMTLLRWYDPVGKFSTVSSAVSHSHGVPPLARFFFSPVGWVLALVGLVLSGVAVATRRLALCYLTIGYGVVVAIIVFVAHAQLVNFANGGPDHTLGVFVTCIGYLTFALGGLVAARSTQVEVADPIRAVERALAWRPGFPLAALGVVVGLFGFLEAAWFAPLQINAGYHRTGTDFKGHGLAAIAMSYFEWLGIVLFVLAVVPAVVATLLRSAALGYVAVVLGAAGLVTTFITLDRLTERGALVASEYGATWDNLGAGGWLACLAFSFLAAAGLLAARGTRERAPTDEVVSSDQVIGVGAVSGTAISGTLIAISIAIVLFYPPTLPLDWQNVVVTQIAAYLLLAVGLNVVVGWAGLLDLGYIAFYGIGSYTAAYFTGALPLKPPHWLILSPLWAIPFAIAACLLAGVILGAPTLRLRGDYLAIVTLGFGEIIQLIAINNPGNLTGGPIGPNVPHPRVHVGPLKITWGLDNLPYWYLLIVLLGIVIVLFHRLEGSRTGRAWAAIREDEVAAQATGIKTTKYKLLAFSIGASTSGVAGVFFGTQIGYFDPTQFTLQNSILIVAYVVFGGMGSLQGALAGAAVLTWLPYFLQSQVPLPDSQMWIGALIMIMMIFRPAGLIPAKRRRAELAGLDRPASAEVTAVPAAEGM
ncbi:MAG TPA: branched-chain amino acid ABC transporter permease [Mycobacteriales bacterium]|nr:branched-chain amino acid ABC transporter permease [Mycobacteriales bacterium]